jgi:hypothetical protein
MQISGVHTLKTGPQATTLEATGKPRTGTHPIATSLRKRGAEKGVIRYQNHSTSLATDPMMIWIRTDVHKPTDNRQPTTDNRQPTTLHRPGTSTNEV